MKEETKRVLLAKLAEGTISKEAYRSLEIASVDDDFLFDALEGYSTVGTNEYQKKKILDKIEKKLKPTSKRRFLPYYITLAAASISILIGALWLFDTKDNLAGGISSQDVASESSISKTKSIEVNEDIYDAANDPLEETESKQLAYNTTPTQEETKSRNFSKKQKPSPSIKKEVPKGEPAIVAPQKEDVNMNSNHAMQGNSFEPKTAAKSYAPKEELQHIVAPPTSSIAEADSEFESIEPDQIPAAKPLNVIRGLVVDPQGIPLIGASITLGDTTKLSDFDGSFAITQDPNQTSIDVSYLGYESSNIPIQKGQSNYIIELKENSMVLDEIVVINTSKSKKSIPTPDWSDFEDKLKQNLIQQLFMLGINKPISFTYKFRVTKDRAIQDIEILNLNNTPLKERIVKTISEIQSSLPKGVLNTEVERSIIIE